MIYDGLGPGDPEDSPASKPASAPAVLFWSLLTIIVFIFAIAVSAIVWGSSPVRAHEWYDPNCCNGNGMSGDCQAIPARAVKVVNGGYEITLLPGDHRLVTKPHTWFRKVEESRISKDDDFHACLYPDENTLRCFYALPLGQ